MPDTRKRVLVVDDDRSLLELLVDTLSSIGYEAVSTIDGAEALEALSKDSFDLMITDVKMPDVDGISLLKRVRRHYPRLPVLFITGVASPEIVAQAGPDGFLAKPFRISHIEELIESTLARFESGYRPHGLRRVLVVDHDEHYRETIAEALAIGNFLPFAASTAVRGLRELNNGEFDAVISEAIPPDMDASEFYERLTATRPDIPVIVIGQPGSLEIVRSRFENDQIAGYLNKPFAASDMVSMLHRVTVPQEEPS